MLAGEGVDLKTLQTIAGHENIQTTMDIYVSPRTDKITAAGETMDRLLNAYASQENGYSSNILAMDATGLCTKRKTLDPLWIKRFLWWCLLDSNQ